MHGSTTTACAGLRAASQRLTLVLGGFGAAGVLMAGGASPLPIGLAMTLAMVSAATALWAARNSAGVTFF